MIYIHSGVTLQKLKEIKISLHLASGALWNRNRENARKSPVKHFECRVSTRGPYLSSITRASLGVLIGWSYCGYVLSFSHFQNGLAHRFVVKRVRFPLRDRLLGAGESFGLNHIESQSAPGERKKSQCRH
jgi:hypothetical protein